MSASWKSLENWVDEFAKIRSSTRISKPVGKTISKMIGDWKGVKVISELKQSNMIRKGTSSKKNQYVGDG